MKRLIRWLVISLVFCFLLILFFTVRTGAIVSEFENEITRDTSSLHDEVKRLSRLPEITSLKFRLSLGESKKDAQTALKKFLTEHEDASACAVVAEGKVLVSAVSDNSGTVPFRHFASSDEMIGGKSKVFYVIKSPVSGLFDREIADVLCLTEVSHHFPVFGLKNATLRADRSKQVLGRIKIPLSELSIAFTVDEVIAEKPAMLNSGKVWVMARFGWGKLFLSYLIFFAGVVVFRRLDKKYALIKYLSEHRPKWMGGGQTDYGDVIGEEIFPMMNNLKIDLFDIKKSLKKDKKIKIKPPDHLDLHEYLERMNDESQSLAQGEIAEKLAAAGKKTALIDDPNVPKHVVYKHEFESRFEEIQWEPVAVSEAAKPEKSEQFTAGKTKLVDSVEEKKIVFNEKYKDSFTSLNLLDD